MYSRLPQDLISKIYSYDATYKQKMNSVIQELQLSFDLYIAIEYFLCRWHGIILPSMTDIKLHLSNKVIAYTNGFTFVHHRDGSMFSFYVSKSEIENVEPFESIINSDCYYIICSLWYPTNFQINQF